MASCPTLVVQLLRTLPNGRDDADYTATPHSFHQTTQCLGPFRRRCGNGILACSGRLNGFFGEGETRHIAHWRSVKYVDEFNEEGETEGETIIRKRERFSHELTLAYESGQIIELKETKEAKPRDEERS